MANKRKDADDVASCQTAGGIVAMGFRRVVKGDQVGYVTPGYPVREGWTLELEAEKE